MCSCVVQVYSWCETCVPVLSRFIAGVIHVFLCCPGLLLVWYMCSCVVQVYCWCDTCVPVLSRFIAGVYMCPCVVQVYCWCDTCVPVLSRFIAGVKHVSLCCPGLLLVYTCVPVLSRFIAGVIPWEKLFAFERMLWFACRGNVFLRQEPIHQKLEDPHTVR